MDAYREAPLRGVCVTCGRDDARRQCARCGASVCDRDMLSPRDYCEGCEEEYAETVHQAEIATGPASMSVVPVLLGYAGVLVGGLLELPVLGLASLALTLISVPWVLIHAHRVHARGVARATELAQRQVLALPPGETRPRA